MDLVRKLVYDVDGATSVEYGLIAGLICVVIVVAVTSVSVQLNLKFSAVSNALN